MNTSYHIKITRKALNHQFSTPALEEIIHANVKQDRIAHLIGHDEIHFDGSAFKSGFEYIANQEKMILEHMNLNEWKSAREAFGRLLHSWQDFYSHSNYVKLWLNNHKISDPKSIIHDDPEILNHPELESGKNYGVIEFLAMVPPISWLIKPMMPKNSHAKMNLDSPTASPVFEYAYWAAFSATNSAYQKTISALDKIQSNQELVKRFKDR